MDLTETKRPKRVVEIIEPNTTRVIEQRQKRMEEERLKQEQEYLQKMMAAKSEEEQRNMQDFLDKQKLLQERMKEEQLRRKIEQEKISNTLTGKFGHIINDLTSNSSNLEFTISGLDLRPAQIKVLVNNVENNASLKALSMSRKKLTDTEGIEICGKLEKNSTLQRLELEGNDLGPATLKALAKLLTVNESIRFIDLQGNNLIDVQSNQNSSEQGTKSKDYQALTAFIQALMVNETVLYINLNNTGLDAMCSYMLRDIFKTNKTLILLDIENNLGTVDNPGMFYDNVQYIQNKLVQNKQMHDDERYKQFIERKRMRREEDISGVILLNQQTKKLRQEAIELNTQTKKKQLDEEWEDFLKKQEIMKAKMIAKLEKEAKKGGKKKKKKSAK